MCQDHLPYLRVFGQGLELVARIRRAIPQLELTGLAEKRGPDGVRSYPSEHYKLILDNQMYSSGSVGILLTQTCQV